MNQNWILLIIIVIIIIIVIVVISNNASNSNKINKTVNKIQTKNIKLESHSDTEIVENENDEYNKLDNKIDNKVLVSSSIFEPLTLITPAITSTPCTECINCPNPCPACAPCICPTPSDLHCAGGIGTNCTLNTDCVNGLSCSGGKCICPKPPAPTVKSIITNGGVTTITWHASAGATSYNIFISGPSPETYLFYNSLSLEVALIEGLYSLLIYAVSASCGEGLPSFSQFNIGQCQADANCPHDMVCNQITGQCVSCLTNTDCPSGDTCLNGTCVQCTSDSQCSDGLVCKSFTCTTCIANNECPFGTVCGSSGLCVVPQCLTSAGCITPPNLVCDTTNFTCVECVSAIDCGGAPNTCTNNLCCFLDPPGITSLVGTNATNSSIAVNFTATVAFTNIKCIFNISVGAGVTIYTSPAIAGLTGTYTLTESNTGVPLYPNTNYTIGLQYQQPCGNTIFTFRTLTMPTSGVSTVNNGFFSNPTNINTGMIVQDLSGPFCNTPGCTFVVSGKVLLSQTPAFHPNLATEVISNLTPVAGTNLCIANTECLADFLAPWAPIVPIAGQTWYGIIMADKGFYTIPSTSDPSGAIPFVNFT